MQLYQKQKTFSEFDPAFLTSTLNFEYFQKKVDNHSWCISEITGRKEALRWASKKCRFTVLFNKQNGKGTQTHFKSSQLHLHHNFWYSTTILSLKNLMLVICKMLWLFVNTFTADDKYSPLNRDNFTQEINMQLSQKRKSFSHFHAAFLTSRLNFQHFQRNVNPHSQCISEIRDLQRGA